MMEELDDTTLQWIINNDQDLADEFYDEEE